MKDFDPVNRVLTLLVGLMFVIVLWGCNNNPTPVVSSESSPPVSDTNLADVQRLSDGPSKLLAAMKRPSDSFRFSYKGSENLTGDKTKPPVIGPVALQADVTPQEIDLKETRGSTIQTSKALYGDEVNWGMADLTTVRVMTSPTLVIAVGASVASPPSTDLVGTVAADKYTFDTAAPSTPSQKIGLERARMVVTTIRECQGTAWIAEDSGQLIKFNIDASYRDVNNHDWKEHYEGVVTPK